MILIKKVNFIITILLALFFKSETLHSQVNNSESIVYFTKDISPIGVMKLFSKIEQYIKGKVGIKVHFVEDGNEYYHPSHL